MTVISAKTLFFALYLVLHNEVRTTEASNGIPDECVESYSDCVREPLFRSCKQTILTPKANVTILPKPSQDQAQLRCLDLNHHNVIITPLFSWIKWTSAANLDSTNLDLDNGSFTHVHDDRIKHVLESTVHNQDMHAQYLTILDLNGSDYGLYTCIICTKYGRSHQSILLTPPPHVPTVPPSQGLTTPTALGTSNRAVASPTSESRTKRNSAIAFFVVGTLLVFAIIISIGFLVRYRVLKHSEREHAASPRPLFPESPTGSPTLITGDPRWRRQCSTSTCSSSLRSSCSSGTTLSKVRRNSRQHNSAMTYISEIDDIEEGEVFDLPLDDLWEIPREHILLQEKLGEGAFGLVIKGVVYGLTDIASGCTVAVKSIKDDATNEEFNDFISEIETMKTIGHHKNIINMLGVCSLDGPILLVVEHAEHGNLRDFLRRHRVTHEDAPENNNLYQTPGDPLIVKSLIPMAYQAAKGMEYLASKKCVHRDLAARNVLLAEDYVVKIADFGLSRNLRETDYYRKTTHGRLPVMWLSIEALFDQKYTLMSDVWSFGVLLWEIFSLGCQPYPGIPVERLFTLLKTGYRMPPTTDCPPEIYAMMLRCWNENPTDRPAMTELAKELDKMVALASSREYLDILSQSRDCIIEDSSDKRETNV